MSRKDFDAKQFLLEKGEHVGLGVAVTLMVLMLILSLFMPSKGFFSGSPKTKAKELNQSTEQLENALRSAQPRDTDLPEQREGKLIAFDTKILDADSYATSNWFEPRMKENKDRRPPKIYNVEEAIAAVAAVPLDTYLFRLEAKPPSIMILGDKAAKGLPGAPGATNSRNNPFAALMRGLPGANAGASPNNNPFLQRQQGRLGQANLGTLSALMGAANNPEFQATWIPLDDWNPQQLTAHQVSPLRMAVIAGSFPYKKQLDEHMYKLRLKSIDEVLSETVGKDDQKTAAFDFLGVEVQRMEVDANDKPLGDWVDPQLKESYQYWLQNTYYPFQQESDKYAMVRPNDGKGLVMPLLREFHATKPGAGGLPFPGMMMPGMAGMPGMSRPGGVGPQAAAPPEEEKTRYPDVAANLTKIRETLDKMRELQPKQIAAPKFQKAQVLDAFNPNAALPGDSSQPPQPSAVPGQPGAANAEQSYVPDYVLVRVVDVTVDPGKFYRYRLKIKMANPNYLRPDVASPEYKEHESLQSNDWYELPQTVKMPQEMFYYVVDEPKGVSPRELRMSFPLESAQYRQLTARGPSADQVAMQFHRWIETTQQSRKDTDQIPVGEWAVAERVFVARGEYVGRKVIVDLPIWKYSQNNFILPAEEKRPKRSAGYKVPTGIEVDFGQDPPENNLILVDFEGGKVSIPSPFVQNKSISDDSAVEVLMLSPDGKLLARNGAKDTFDDDRKNRRAEVLKRIQDVREGKGAE